MEKETKVLEAKRKSLLQFHLDFIKEVFKITKEQTYI